MTNWKYAFTLKVNNIRYPMPEDYQTWLDYAKIKQFTVIEYYYEIDSIGKLHIHGIASAKRNFYYKSLKQKGIHQCIKQLPEAIDLHRWSQYIKKDKTKFDLEVYRKSIERKLEEENHEEYEKWLKEVRDKDPHYNLDLNAP